MELTRTETGRFGKASPDSVVAALIITGSGLAAVATSLTYSQPSALVPSARIDVPAAKSSRPSEGPGLSYSLAAPIRFHSAGEPTPQMRDLDAAQFAPAQLVTDAKSSDQPMRLAPLQPETSIVSSSPLEPKSAGSHSLNTSGTSSALAEVAVVKVEGHQPGSRSAEMLGQDHPGPIVAKVSLDLSEDLAAPPTSVVQPASSSSAALIAGTNTLASSTLPIPLSETAPSVSLVVSEAEVAPPPDQEVAPPPDQEGAPPPDQIVAAEVRLGEAPVLVAWTGEPEEPFRRAVVDTGRRAQEAEPIGVDPRSVRALEPVASAPREIGRRYRYTDRGLEFEIEAQVRGAPARNISLLIDGNLNTVASAIFVELEDILALVEPIMDRHEFEALRNSSSVHEYVSLNKLRAAGLAIDFDAQDKLVFGVR